MAGEALKKWQEEELPRLLDAYQDAELDELCTDLTTAAWQASTEHIASRVAASAHACSSVIVRDSMRLLAAEIRQAKP